MSSVIANESLVSSATDGPIITAIGAVTCIPAACVIGLPAGFFYIGRVLRISASGEISSAITTPGTARYDVRLGGVVVFDGLAILLEKTVPLSAVGWKLDIELICRSVGSGTAATLWGVATWTCVDIVGTALFTGAAQRGALTAMLPWNSAPAAGGGFDSTVTNTLDMFFAQTVNTGSMTVHTYVVTACN